MHPLARRPLLSPVWPATDNWRPHRHAVRMIENVPYGEGEPLACRQIDVVLPTRTASQEPSPWVLFAHGGAWKRHDRRMLRWFTGLYTNVGAAFARAGIGAAIAGYRTGPGATAASGLDDLLAAFRCVRANADAWGLDPDRAVVMGHSAGAHLATVMGQRGDDGVRPRGVIAMAGYYDVERVAPAFTGASREKFDALFGGTHGEAARTWSPERSLDAPTMPPMLVGIAQHEIASLRPEYEGLIAACRAAGVAVESLDVAGCGHMGLVLQMGAARDAVTGPLVAFVRRVCTT
ncbi:MAG: alpha/beta hydrolase [Deltaproteobacteria bacterium]